MKMLFLHNIYVSGLFEEIMKSRYLSTIRGAIILGTVLLAAGCKEDNSEEKKRRNNASLTFTWHPPSRTPLIRPLKADCIISR
jgi:hypothetical protein